MLAVIGEDQQRMSTAPALSQHLSRGHGRCRNPTFLGMTHLIMTAGAKMVQMLMTWAVSAVVWVKLGFSCNFRHWFSYLRKLSMFADSDSET